MKNVSQIFFSALFALALSACGSGNNSTTNTGLNGSITGSGINGTTGGCQAISASGSQLTFAGTGILMTDNIFRAGNLSTMGYSTYGQMAMGSTGTGGSTSISYNGGSPKSGGLVYYSDTLTVYTTPTSSVSSTDGTVTANITGTFGLGALDAQYILSRTSSGATVCGIAVDATQSLQIPLEYASYGQNSYSSTLNFIGSASVYLTLSTGQVVGPFRF